MNQAKLFQRAVLVALSLGALLLVTTLRGVNAIEQANAQAARHKIRICHATDSHTNPYTNPEVDQDAADGDLDNDYGQGDHYLEHVGPVWRVGIADHSWGDIIPPIPDVHRGLNWTDEGQAFWNNNCAVPTTSPSPSPTTEPTLVASPSPSPLSSPSVSPSGSPSPSPSTRGTTSPTPTPSSPTPTPSPSLGKQNRMGIDVTCSDIFDVVADLTDNGNPVEGVVVTFNYNPEAQATTNRDGRAKVSFPRLHEGPITARAEGYPTQTAYVTFKHCENTGTSGAVLGASTTSSSSNSGTSTPSRSGQVLGATTLANTGATDEQLALVAFGAGLVGVLLAIRWYSTAHEQ